MVQLWLSFVSIVGGMMFHGTVQLWFSCGSVWLLFDVCGSVWFRCGLAWCGSVPLRVSFGSALAWPDFIWFSLDSGVAQLCVACC